MLIALDWLILVVLLGGLVRGYMVGAVRQIGSLLGLALALLLSAQFMIPAGTLLVANLGLSESLVPLAGFAVVFVSVYLLVLLLSGLVEHLLSSLSLSIVNRAVGGAVGAVKAALLMSLLLLALRGMQVPSPQTRQASALYTPVVRLLPQALEASEKWLPAAQEAADTLERQIRSTLDTDPQAPADASPPRSEEVRVPSP
jgi:membrane protein required for colicin V production